MSDIRKWREKYINDNELEAMYLSHSLKFIEYIEAKEKGDRIIDIDKSDLRGSVAYQNKIGKINTISTMDNHLNAIKSFFTYLQKEGKHKNIFNEISDYEIFRELIISDFKLNNTELRGYLPKQVIIDLLKYLEICPNKRNTNEMLSIFIRLNLLAPTKRSVIAGLRLKDFDKEFRSVTINHVQIKITRALSKDIKTALEKKEVVLGRKCDKEDYIFAYLAPTERKLDKLPDNIFNRPMYLALKDIDFDVPNSKKGKESFSVEVIMNTGILEMVQNNTNPLLISKISGLNLSTIDKKIRQFQGEEFEIKDCDELINLSISKSEYYQYI